MAYMSPDMYRRVLADAKTLINRAEDCLNGQTTDGLIAPMIFEDDKDALEEVISKCENMEDRLLVAIRGLSQGSPPKNKYQIALEEIRSVKEKLQSF